MMMLPAFTTEKKEEGFQQQVSKREKPKDRQSFHAVFFLSI